MKFVILATLAALAVAAPRADYRSIESGESAEILRHDFDIEDDGTYVLGVETSNGIVASQSGAPSGPDYAVVKQGYFSSKSDTKHDMHDHQLGEACGNTLPSSHTRRSNVILAALATVAVAAPGYDSSAEDSSEEIPILRHDFVLEDDGRYNLDVETGNGIQVSQSGSPDGPEDSVVKSGFFSYTAPDGTPVYVKFVADENGYQPESDLLPVAPEFPHEIPQFVLDQIAKAAEEDRDRSLEAPSDRYGSR
ncbi:hypothetical protein Pmani_003015 [Petrolisthes manimaculis]|uniref:Uncharacterized protein n=1 Tax=Petrolisthes manimaculis TaxID=1843537 RepID=A0AAE1QH82_9EUCA|nr:hypothetical protein Pmani_003015 [Petrolisthes manimaculis]